MSIIRSENTPLMVPRCVFNDWRLSPQTRWLLATFYAENVGDFSYDATIVRYASADNAPSPASLEESILVLVKYGYLTVSDGELSLVYHESVRIPNIGGAE